MTILTRILTRVLTRSRVLIILTALFFLIPSLVFANSTNELIRQIEGEAVKTGSDSLFIMQDGRLIYENRFGHAARVQSLQSVTKSVVAVAIGVLIDRGAIPSFSEPMTTWIPSWKNDPRKSKITLRMLLSHTSGLPNDPEIFNSNDTIRFAINRDLVAEPGAEFIYSGVGSALLQHVIVKASGTSLEQFVDQALFLPLGIQTRRWAKDRQGQESTGGGLFLEPRDLLKFGVMMLGRGEFKGRRVLSESSHHMIVSKSQSLKDYGLMWWLRLPFEGRVDEFKVYNAAGWGGQHLVIYPEKNVVAVRTRDPQTIGGKDADYQSFHEFPNMIARWR